MQIYIHRNNQQLGPFTEAEVKAQLAAGTISPQDNVWWQGQPGWMPLAQSSLMLPPGVTPPPAAAPAPPMPQVGGATQPTSQLAIWSLVCGCGSLLCGIFASIPAIILGHMAQTEIKKNPAIPGKGMALAGTILGYVFTTLIVLYLIAIVVLIALGNNVKDVFKTIQAQENAAADTTNSADQTTNAPDQSTNSTDQPAAAPVNSPDQSTNSATATPATPDQSTSSTDSSTNSSSTNAAPMSQ